MKNKINILLGFILLLICGVTSGYAQDVNSKTEAELKQNQPAVGDHIVKYPFNVASQRSSTGSMTIISGDSLSTFPSSNLLEMLSGKIPSGYFSTTNYSPGNIVVNGSIRGLGWSTMVDGMNNSISELDPMEVEDVSVIKGITDRAILGSEAKFNLLMVNTKRGKIGENKFNASVEVGTRLSQNLPSWASGYENALIYNQACLNDGLSPKYNSDFLNGVQSGLNTLRYPNENYYGKLFNSASAYRRVGISYSGGGPKTRYFVFMGYLNEGNGLMKIQERSLDRYSLRGNLDTKLTDNLTLSLDFVGRFNYLNIPVNESNIFNVVSTYPSFALPIVAKSDPADFRYGRTLDFAVNPIAEQTLMGGARNNNQYGQSKIQLSYDMHSITEGLSFTTGLNYNIYTSLSYQRKNGLTFKMLEPVYVRTPAGADSLTYTSYGLDKLALTSAQTSDDIEQNFVTFGKLAYVHSFGSHKIDGALIDYYRYSYPRDKGASVAKNDLNFTARYSYKNKYFAEAGLTYSRDNYLPEVNRGGIFPAFGFGWIMSEESFIKDRKFINYLKLRANYGVIGSTDVTNYYLTQSQWVVPGSVSFGPSSGPKSYSATSQAQTGNPNLDWVKNKQFDAGIDVSFLNNKFYMELNAYNYNIDGTLMAELAPKVVGNFVKMVNVGRNRYYGTELYLEYSGKMREFTYNVGINASWKQSEILEDNNPVYPHPWMNRIGNSTDGIYGYVAQGLFKSQEDIDNSDRQYLGNVRSGDIKYTDLDGNQKIEPTVDVKMIGHSSPSYLFGLNLNLGYKNFGLFVQGTGITDVDLNVVSNTFFRPTQKSKYSVYAAERLKNGDFPSPTTGSSSNNGNYSTYWLMDGTYFKIKNVELSYTLPKNLVQTIQCSKVKFFVRGTNLLTLTKVPDLDPEALSAGISSYPSTMSLTGGVNVTF